MSMLIGGSQEMKTDAYMQKVANDILAKDNLSEVISDCDEFFREYKDRTLTTSSVEEFL